MGLIKTIKIENCNKNDENVFIINYLINDNAKVLVQYDEINRTFLQKLRFLDKKVMVDTFKSDFAKDSDVHESNFNVFSNDDINITEDEFQERCDYAFEIYQILLERWDLIDCIIHDDILGVLNGDSLKKERTEEENEFDMIRIVSACVTLSYNFKEVDDFARKIAKVIGIDEGSYDNTIKENVDAGNLIKYDLIFSF